MRFLPYHSVGRREGVLPAFPLDKMEFPGNPVRVVERPLVAVCQEISQDDHQMLLNPDVFIGGKEMIIKVAVPHQFKLRVIPDFRTLFFPIRRISTISGDQRSFPRLLTRRRRARQIARLGGEEEETAKKMLIEHNLRLVVYIAKKFDNTGVGVEDLISIGTIGLIKAINTFDPSKKIKLATYASRCIENEILMYLRRNSKTRMEVSIDEPLNVDWDGNELLLSDILGTEEDTIYRDLESEAERKLLVRAIQRLGRRERAIIKMRLAWGPRTGRRRPRRKWRICWESLSLISPGWEKKIMQRLRREMVKYS